LTVFSQFSATILL